MGTSDSGKHVRSNRRPQPPKPDSDASDNDLGSDSSSNPIGLQLGFNESECSSDSNSNAVGNDSGYCTEEQLEEFMLKKLELLYDEAIAKLVASGHDKEIVLKAILRNGHCHGSMDALTNILHNTLRYLNIPGGRREGQLVNSNQVFADLKQLREFSLVCLVCLVRRVRPSFSRTDAMWSLLMCELHVGRASEIEIPNYDGGSESELSVSSINTDDSVGVITASCRFDGGLGFPKRSTSDFPVNSPLPRSDSEDTTQRDIDRPKWSDVVNPATSSLLKTNVAIFAAEYKKMKKKLAQPDGSTSLSIDDSSSGKAQESLETVSLKNQETTDIMLKEFGHLNLEGETKDEKDDMLISLMSEIKSLQKKVKERKEWAYEKAMQAAKKLCQDINELKKLRIEKDEREKTQQVKEENPTVEEENPTLKSLAEVETALRKASGGLDRENMVMKRLEIENMEIRAEKEAAQLSASESKAMCLDAAKRKKKHQKEVLAWETQRTKMQEEITSEQQKLMDLHQEILQVEAAKRTVEGKWREVQKAKEGALARVQHEMRMKEETEANIKRKQESLQSKLDMNCKRYKDNIHRLEQERMKMMLNSSPNLTNHAQHDTIGKCLICKTREPSIVFLPCDHQVVCGGCNDQGKKKCPCCRVFIKQRVRVFAC